MKTNDTLMTVAATLLCLLTVAISSNVSATDCGCGCGTPTTTPAQGIVYGQPTAATSCGCRRRVSCPQCDCQFCELTAKKGEVEKSSYKIEQKEVCVPAVRLPWKKACPPTKSKVRTINTLKKVKHKCPKCEYKWKVNEPEDFGSSATDSGNVEPAGSGTTSSSVPSSGGSGAKGYDSTGGSGAKSVIQDPGNAWTEVPRPPMENTK